MSALVLMILLNELTTFKNEKKLLTSQGVERLSVRTACLLSWCSVLNSL